jgi:hypothetical protein
MEKISPNQAFRWTLTLSFSVTIYLEYQRLSTGNWKSIIYTFLSLFFIGMYFRFFATNAIFVNYGKKRTNGIKYAAILGLGISGIMWALLYIGTIHIGYPYQLGFKPLLYFLAMTTPFTVLDILKNTGEASREVFLIFCKHKINSIDMQLRSDHHS